MDRVLKIPIFDRWMAKSGLSDPDLRRAVDEMKRGLIDADLGGGLVKKRVAILGRGKRGGARTLVATNRKGRWIFLLGFLKNEKANITLKELEALKELSGDFLSLSEDEIHYAVKKLKLLEVPYETHS